LLQISLQGNYVIIIELAPANYLDPGTVAGTGFPDYFLNFGIPNFRTKIDGDYVRHSLSGVAQSFQSHILYSVILSASPSFYRHQERQCIVPLLFPAH
jgi:hypothetical protein